MYARGSPPGGLSGCVVKLQGLQRGMCNFGAVCLCPDLEAVDPRHWPMARKQGAETGKKTGKEKGKERVKERGAFSKF